MQQYDLQGNVYDIQINTSHEKTAKEMLEGRSEENQWLMGCYDQCKETLDKIKELEGGYNE